MVWGEWGKLQQLEIITAINVCINNLEENNNLAIHKGFLNVIILTTAPKQFHAINKYNEHKN